MPWPHAYSVHCILQVNNSPSDRIHALLVPYTALNSAPSRSTRVHVTKANLSRFGFGYRHTTRLFTQKPLVNWRLGAFRHACTVSWCIVSACISSNVFADLRVCMWPEPDSEKLEFSFLPKKINSNFFEIGLGDMHIKPTQMTGTTHRLCLHCYLIRGTIFTYFF